MITKISSNKINNNFQQNITQSFHGGGFDTLTKAADIFVKSQENLSSTRFIQDTATNWFPKAIFSRSKADFAEMSFLEFLESAIFYFASPLLGEKLFRNKVFKNLIPNEIRNDVNGQIAKPLKEIIENPILTDKIKNQAIAKKAGIVLACTAIPVAEYTLSFAKNLFTLKTFKKSNFNDIANLDKQNAQGEDKEQQKRVEENSKKHLKRGAIISVIGLAAGLLLAKNADKSEPLQNVCKTILEPGQTASNLLHKTGIKSQKADKLLNSLSLDFANDNGKLALSKGQLAFTAIAGLFGYSKAAEDRGKLDVQEVWTRVPLVVFYTIFGSELFEKGFTKILNKTNKCQDVLKTAENGAVSVLKRAELDKLAQKLSETNNTPVKEELSKLIKQKAFVSAVPYAFSLLFMGFSLSAITRFCTQRRYNKQKMEETKKLLENNTIQEAQENIPEIFDELETFNN